MKVILAGGSGLIGKVLAQNLIDHGYEVVVLSRKPEKVVGLPEHVRIVKWDGKTAQGWGSEIEGAAAVVNLAGENLAGEKFFPTRWTDARKKLLYQSRIDPGKAIAEAVRQADNKPKVVVQASAIGYYGPQGDEKLNEASPAGTDYLAQLCVDWENATLPVEEMGVRRVIIRTGIYLTPEGGALLRLLLPFKLFAGGPFGTGKQYYSWIHPQDEIEAIRFLIENSEAHGVFNITAPNPVSNKDFSKALGRVLRRPSIMPVPGFAMKMAFGEVSTVVLDGQRVIPEKLQAMGFKFEFPEIEGAFRNLL